MRRSNIRKFARMFLDAAGNVPVAIDELRTLDSLLEKNREFRSLFENPLFSNEERAGIIKDLSGRLALSDNTARFILFLSDKGLILRLKELTDITNDLYLERENRVRAVITTPIAITKDHEDRLRDSLRKLTGRESDIEYIIDPSILGGMLVRVGSTLYDSSIRGQLRLLKHEIMKG